MQKIVKETLWQMWLCTLQSFEFKRQRSRTKIRVATGVSNIIDQTPTKRVNTSWFLDTQVYLDLFKFRFLMIMFSEKINKHILVVGVVGSQMWPEEEFTGTKLFNCSRLSLKSLQIQLKMFSRIFSRFSNLQEILKVVDNCFIISTTVATL